MGKLFPRRKDRIIDTKPEFARLFLSFLSHHLPEVKQTDICGLATYVLQQGDATDKPMSLCTAL